MSALKKEFELFESKIGIDSLKESFTDIIRRLKNEIDDLRLRANVNLGIGIAIAFVGVGLLIYIVYAVNTSEVLNTLASGGSETNDKFIKHLSLTLIPKILLVFFIEMFAYFFLKLYKNGLEEIKYFQNELTNIESKLISVEVSFVTKNEESMKEALKVLVQTERNFVLKKGETTVELERAKSESENMQNIIRAVPNLFKSKGK